MWALYDNLVATAVAGTVMLMLVSIQMRATSANVAQTGRYAALNQARTVATWVEEDLKAMGRNRDEGDSIFDIVAASNRVENAHSPTGTVLRSSSDPAGLTLYYESGAGTDTTLTYELIEADTRTVDGTERTVYRLRRQKNGTVSGGSGAGLGYFDISFLDRNANRVSNPTANRESIRAIRAQFSVLPPVQNDETALSEIHRMVVVPYGPAL